MRPDRAVGKQAESLDDLPLSKLDAARDASAFQNGSALVGLRMPVGAAVPEPAVLAPDGAKDLGAPTDPVR